jgi:hypothetical protein
MECNGSVRQFSTADGEWGFPCIHVEFRQEYLMKAISAVAPVNAALNILPLEHCPV